MTVMVMMVFSADGFAFGSNCMPALPDVISTRLVLDEDTWYSDCESGGLEVVPMVIGMVALGAYCIEEANPMVIVGGGAGVIVNTLVAVPLG